MNNKLYQSEKWLTRKYQRQRMNAKEIADLCGVDEATIWRYLVKFGLKKKSRKL